MALEQWPSAKLCGMVQGMELWNFCRGRYLYLAGRPSRWASAHILVGVGFYSTARDIDAVESVQRRITKCMCGHNHFSYSRRFSRLKLQSLGYRRVIADLLWCYEIVFNVEDISIDEFFCFNTCTHTRGHAYKLYKSQPLTEKFFLILTSIRKKNFFSERVMTVWNVLPGDVVAFTSLSRVCSSILKIDLCSELKCSEFF